MSANWRIAIFYIPIYILYFYILVKYFFYRDFCHEIDFCLEKEIKNSD